MQAVFYTFSKKENSTEQPAGVGGATKNIHLKNDCSVTSPTITLEWSGGGSPAAWNYMHIPDFNRYYFIENWTWENRTWTATGRVDALASWKSYIGGSAKYILRSAAAENPYVVEGSYPANMPVYNFSSPLSGFDWGTTFASGAYVVSLIGSRNSFSIAGASYYVLSATELSDLIGSAFTENEYIWGDTITSTDLGEILSEYGGKLSKSIDNPSQFINSVYWVPFVPTTSGRRLLYLGDCLTGVTGGVLSEPVHIDYFTCQIWDGSAAKLWKRIPPFCEYSLYIPPFGTFPLDPYRIASANSINGVIKTDVTQGEAILEVYCGGYILFNAQAKIGSDIALSGVNRNYAGAAQTAISGAKDTLQSFLRGDFLGGASNAVSAGISTMQAGAPIATNGGFGGGLAALQGWKGVVTTFLLPADSDPTDKGYPLMETRSIGTLSGYIQCADGEISAPASKAELEEIRSYLTRGFYYE